jgi:hypothetical protein
MTNLCLKIATVIGGKKGMVAAGVSYLVFMIVLNISLFAIFFIATDYYTAQFDSVIFTGFAAASVQYVVMYLYGKTISEKEIQQYSKVMISNMEKLMAVGEKA